MYILSLHYEFPAVWRQARTYISLGRQGQRLDRTVPFDQRKNALGSNPFQNVNKSALIRDRIARRATVAGSISSLNPFDDGNRPPCHLNLRQIEGDSEQYISSRIHQMPCCNVASICSSLDQRFPFTRL